MYLYIGNVICKWQHLLDGLKKLFSNVVGPLQVKYFFLQVGLMREGRLLAEADPEYLIKTHNAVTLEDVFLKLCVKEMSATEVMEDSNVFGDPKDMNNLNQESREDVWVSQQVRNLNPTK